MSFGSGTGIGTHCGCETLRLVRTRSFSLMGRGRKSNIWVRHLHEWFIWFSCNSHHHHLFIPHLEAIRLFVCWKDEKNPPQACLVSCYRMPAPWGISGIVRWVSQWWGLGRGGNWSRASGKHIKLALYMYFRATVERGFGFAVCWWMLHRLSQLDWYGTRTIQTWQRMSFIAWVPALSWVMWVLV